MILCASFFSLKQETDDQLPSIENFRMVNGEGVSVARMMERSVGDWNCNGDMGERISSLPYFKELEMLASVLRFLS